MFVTKLANAVTRASHLTIIKKPILIPNIGKNAHFVTKKLKTHRIYLITLVMKTAYADIREQRNTTPH